jgi:hypothetical protein
MPQRHCSGDLPHVLEPVSKRVAISSTRGPPNIPWSHTAATTMRQTVTYSMTDPIQNSTLCPRLPSSEAAFRDWPRLTTRPSNCPRAPRSLFTNRAIAWEGGSGPIESKSTSAARVASCRLSVGPGRCRRCKVQSGASTTTCCTTWPWTSGCP